MLLQRSVTVLGLLLLLSFHSLIGQSRAPRFEADVIVYGGNSAGVVAAVQAARMGKDVILVCPERHLGGLTSGGLGFTDSGHTKVIGGLAREFYHRVWKKYRSQETWRWQRREEFENRGQGTAAIDDATKTMWTFEPHVAEAVFDDWGIQAGVRMHRNEWLNRESGVELRKGNIVAITTRSGQRYEAGVFIDATYEGDLMAAAGVAYRVGREANAEFGENWNGVQVGVLHHRHNFGIPGLKVDPYRLRGIRPAGSCPRCPINQRDERAKQTSGFKRIAFGCVCRITRRTECLLPDLRSTTATTIAYWVEFLRRAGMKPFKNSM